MKLIIFTLCVFFALMTLADSAEIYQCIGENGKMFFTDNPPQNAKCKNSSGEDADTNQQQQQTGDENNQTNQRDESKSQTDRAKKLIKIPRLGY